MDRHNAISAMLSESASVVWSSTSRVASVTRTTWGNAAPKDYIDVDRFDPDLRDAELAAAVEALAARAKWEGLPQETSTWSRVIPMMTL